MIKNSSTLASDSFILAFLSLLVVIVFISFIFPSNIDSLEIKLTWDKHKEGEMISGYRIFYREEDQKYNYNEPAWEGSDTTCTISDLDSDKVYYFVARAFDRLGNESDNSNEERYQAPLNITPKAFNQRITIQENQSIGITLTAADYNDHLTYIIVDQPLYGTLSGTPPTLTYSPDVDYNGLDNFTFKANDGKEDSNLANIRVFVNSIHDPPIENTDQDQKNEWEDDTSNNTIENNMDTDEDNPFNDELERNTAPSAPALNYPADHSEIDTLEIFLSVGNASDTDEQPLTYTFEIYSDQGLNALVTAVSGIPEGENTTPWRVDTLLDENRFYYWRAGVFDGIVYSEWMDTARFFVNTSNDAPSIPRISSPPDKSEVCTLQPTLEVNNASDKDLDPLEYVLEVYLDPDMNDLICVKTILVEGSTGTTGWQINTPLEDHTFYWWRVRAKDNEDESSGWTNLSQFFVNTSHDPPSIPKMMSPKKAQEVDTLFPILEVKNSQDIDLNHDKLTYFFEIDQAKSFATYSLERSREIFKSEGDNMISWAPSSQLEDNTLYYWRSRAYDGAAYSLWTTDSFFVNLDNDPPTPPTINNPGNNTQVSTSKPVLRVNPSIDVDFDQIAYDFELYFDADLSDLAAALHSTKTSCKVRVPLENRQRYFWKARALDEHGASSEWSDICSFWVNVKNHPKSPTINNPVSGGIVISVMPTLSINNSNGQDNDPLYYEFELFSDKDLSHKVASSPKIFQKNIITSWRVSSSLSDNTTYYWRVRASDGDLASQWMPTARFVVDTSGGEAIRDLESSKDISAKVQVTQKIEVTNHESPINGVSLEIPPGAVSNDCTITIGFITNPPALPDNTKAIGKVIEFGPSGTTFSQRITVMIPYSQEDLDNAGIEDPAQLEVFTYNVSKRLWEKIQVDHVDRINSLLICKTDHFSMFTTGISLETMQIWDQGKYLEFKGGCFIEGITSCSKSLP